MSWAKEFGAVGDGVADDTSALQHAADSGDGVLELSRGTYRITAPVIFHLTRRGFAGIRGDQGTARVLMAGPGPAFRIQGDHQGTADPWTVKEHTWTRERFPIISGVEIVGDHTDAVGVELVRTMQATLHSLSIRNCKYGVHLVERNRNFILSGSHLYHNSDSGVFFDRCNLHQANLFGNHISYNSRAGIRQWDGDVHNLQIVGNDIEYNSGDQPLSGEILLEAGEGVTSEVTIANNTLQATPDAPGANVFLVGKPGDSADSIRLVSITGNVLGSREKNLLIRHGQRLAITGNTIYSGTSLNLHLENCRYCVVSGNTMTSRPAGYKSESRDGVLLEKCVGCSVVGNVLNDTACGDETRGGAMTIRDSADIHISSCQVFDPVYRGIHLENCSRCRISGSVVIERLADKRMVAAIEVTGTGGGNLADNNLFSRGTKGGVVMEESLGREMGNYQQV